MWTRIGISLAALACVAPAFAADEAKDGKQMVTTILEAHVAKDRIPELKKIFEEAMGQLTPGIVETSLLQDGMDPTLLKIVTVWRSRQVLEEMRKQPGKPKGVQMFEAVGAAPKLSIQDVLVRSTGGR